ALCEDILAIAAGGRHLYGCVSYRRDFGLRSGTRVSRKARRRKHLALQLEDRMQTRIERARTGRAYRARVGKCCSAGGKIRQRRSVEKRAIGGITIVEQIIDPANELDRLVDLI